MWLILIFFHPGALKIVSFSNTPYLITQGSKKDFECVFSGWPRPRMVSWYKDGQLITNGTEGIYHLEDMTWNKGEETLRTKLYLPPGRETQEGLYKCIAINNISGWSSDVSAGIRLIYECMQYCLVT